MPTFDAIRGELLRLADRDLGRYEFARKAARVLRRAVPFDGVAAVWLDPETGLPVDEWIDGGARLPEIDITAFRQQAASGRRATAAVLDLGSPPRGLGDALRVVRSGDSGVWAAYEMYREPGAPGFTRREVNLMASLNGDCADLQRERLRQDLASDAGEGDPGLLLLDDRDHIDMATAEAGAWLDELRAPRGGLPLVVSAVAERARENGGGLVTARAQTTSGRWITVRGWALENSARTAITLEPARSPELAGLRADAYDLRPSERRVCMLVAQGLPNAEIATQLYLSVYTVQDHLKAIFEKLDVSNRGQLVAKLFLDPVLTPARSTAHG